MERGTVVWFNNSKGFGFIKRDGKPDVFVHFTGINTEGYKTLTENDEVEFEVTMGPKQKPQAVNVSVVGR